VDFETVGLIGAILEMNFNTLSKYKDLEVNGEKFTVLDVGECPVPNETGAKYKAITVKDENNNIFVHFNGTDDGFWKENDVAAGGGPSGVQEWALEYFNRTYKEKYEGQSRESLFVTGHSQGGNNAQYVSIRSPHADDITMCVSLDGPGFSNKFLEDAKEWGEAYYERQRNKIYGIYGEHDFASAYAQNDIIDESHIKFVKQSTQEQVKKPSNNPLDRFHAVEYMVHQNEKGDWAWNDEAESSAFRELIKKLSEKLYETYKDDEETRRLLGIFLGGIAEKFLGDIYPGDLTSQDFEYLKEKFIPVLVSVLHDNPELIAPALQAFDIDAQSAESIANLLEHINTYPEVIREAALVEFLNLVKYENGKFTPDLLKIPNTLIAFWPVIFETALTHPDDLFSVLKESVENWLTENMDKAACVALFLGIMLIAFPEVIFTILTIVGIVTTITVGIAKIIFTICLIIDVIIRIAQGIAWRITKGLDDFIKAFNAIKNALQTLSKKLSDWWNKAGKEYASANPYFKVDTDKLRNYANRINNVNKRLRALDSALKSAFWQVGFFDLDRFGWIIFLTSGSPTLNQVRDYLNDAASRLESADNKACGYVGG